MVDGIDSWRKAMLMLDERSRIAYSLWREM
jgi:hypothetical protein